jgi:hypothetical protein
MKRLLRNYCNTKLNRTASNNFSFVADAVIISPEDADSMFSETLVSTYESIPRHNPEEGRNLHHCENLKFLPCVYQQEIVWITLLYEIIFM